MNLNWKAILAAFATSSIFTLAGVLLILNPVAETDIPGGPLVPSAVGFFIYVILSIALFDWIARQMRNAYKAAFVIAVSQFILVNVDFVLAGKRGLMTAGASTILLILTWGSVAFVYSYFVKLEGAASGTQVTKNDTQRGSI